MVDPNQIGAALDKFFNITILTKVMTYIGYVLIGVIILAVLIAIYYWIQYKYKVFYPVLLYDSDGNSAQIIKIKSDRARIVKRKDGKRYTSFLFQRKKSEPLQQQHIKPGNKVYLLRINDDGTYTTLPSLKLDHEGKPIQFEYLTPGQKNWAMAELKESAIANETPDAVKKIMTYLIITVILCLVAAVVSVWLAVKAPNQAAQAATTIADSLRGVSTNIIGAAPN